MDQNELDILELHKNPGKLLIRYQPYIRMIIISYLNRGCGHRSDLEDMIQEVNRKLLERMPRIRDRFNGKSCFKTYFSVVIRNVFLEEVRKVHMVAEPPPTENYLNGLQDRPPGELVIRQEIERLQRAISLFGNEGPLIRLTLRFLFNIELTPDDLTGFQLTDETGDGHELLYALNQFNSMLRKERLKVLSEILPRLGVKPRKPDALRKWFNSRFKGLLQLMNGDPPTSAYTGETLQILVEKWDEYEKK
ncbi:MAG: sigma-70 family RNA polymerase sigma factor [Bacteroidales bacterium]|nr:sigma-70 family RNA polymerase sigma factor [Bacteroidales bacterium]